MRNYIYTTNIIYFQSENTQFTSYNSQQMLPDCTEHVDLV